MFLNSYKPRSYKVKTSYNKKLIRYFIMLLTLIIIVLVFFNNRSTLNQGILENNIFEGNYDKSENLVKIEKAKLVGIEKKNRPYTITAEKAINKNNEKNTFFLYNVAADISRLNGKWLIINTKKADYDIENKILLSREDVEIFYDDGSSIATNNMKYNFKLGKLSCNDGIVMFGKWGKLTAGSLIYDSDKETFEFNSNPKVVFN